MECAKERGSKIYWFLGSAVGVIMGAPHVMTMVAKNLISESAPSAALIAMRRNTHNFRSHRFRHKDEQRAGIRAAETGAAGEYPIGPACRPANAFALYLSRFLLLWR